MTQEPDRYRIPDVQTALAFSWRPAGFDHEITLREFLRLQLQTLWDKPEEFFDTQTFGQEEKDSLAEALVRADLIWGKFSEDGRLYLGYSGYAFDQLVTACIAAL